MVSNAMNSAQVFLRYGFKLRHVHLLIALENTRSITGAAESLGISQVGASKGLAQIEAGIGAKLFERRRGGLEPTETALRFLDASRKILSEIKSLEEEFTMLTKGFKGRVRIGIQTLSVQSFLTRVITAFKCSSPLITIELVSGNIIDLMNDLMRADVQFVIGHQNVPALGPGIMGEVIPSEPLVVVAGTAVNKESPTWAELLNYPWCLPPPGTPLRAHFDHVITVHHLSTPPILVETSATLLAEALIQRGGFLAITSSSTAEDWKTRGFVRILPIEVPPMADPVRLIWSERAPLSRSAKLFLACVRRHLKDESLVLQKSTADS
jgi:LysR family transcriptional regulator, pca operon transcriptional activator